MNGRELAKYFIHGIAFSILFLILGIAWTFVLLFLVHIGFIIGLIIGLGLLFPMIGYLNSVVTVQLWFQVKTSFWDLFFHGLVLFIILLVITGIFVTVPSSVFPGIATTLTTLLIAALLDGLVAKRIAGLWKQEYPEGIPKAIATEWRDKEI